MNKELLLKVLKAGVLVLFAVGFLLPFITGTMAGILDYSYTSLELEELNADKSADLYVYLFFVVTLAALAVMYFKPEFERVANLATLGLGLVLVVVIYILVFNDSDLKLAVDFGLMTAKIGFGIIFQVVMVVVGVVLEFFGKQLLKV
jgi:hypothetical protein